MNHENQLSIDVRNLFTHSPALPPSLIPSDKILRRKLSIVSVAAQTLHDTLLPFGHSKLSIRKKQVTGSVGCVLWGATPQEPGVSMDIWTSPYKGVRSFVHSAGLTTQTSRNSWPQKQFPASSGNSWQPRRSSHCKWLTVRVDRRTVYSHFEVV